MAKEDQEMRFGEWNSKIDKKNTARMKEIVKNYGWPGKTLVGKDGAFAAWLLVQHADLDLKFQKKALSLMEVAVQRGDAGKKEFAYLIDRVRVNSDKPQVFGTQFFRKDGKMIPRPIEDEKHLEKRRKEYGLPSFSEYAKVMSSKKTGGEA